MADKMRADNITIDAISTPKALSDAELTSSSSENEVEITYPEGGLQAWLVVFGCFLTMVASFGFMNCIGVVAIMLHADRLPSHTEGEIGWIFGIYVAICFAGGIVIGPIFDLYGPTGLMVTGGLTMAAAFVFTSFCTQLWQFVLVLGVLMGSCSSMVFTPSCTTIGHWFLERRGLATGLACTGGSVGGIVFALLLRYLDKRLGFAWSIRIVGAICIALIAISCVLVRGRDFYALSSGKAENSGRPSFSFQLIAQNIDLLAFKDLTFSLTTAGIFMVEWAYFSPMTYLITFALSLDNFDPDLAYQLIAILNASSFFGRWLPGLLADRIGRFNTMIGTLGMCALASFGLWLPAWYARAQGSDITVGLLVTFSIIYGFGSGSGIGITPVCVGQICETRDYGKRYGTAYSVVSLGVLTGIPIAGEIVSKGKGDFVGLVLFTGCSYLLALAFFGAARISGGGWKWTVF